MRSARERATGCFWINTWAAGVGVWTCEWHGDERMSLRLGSGQAYHNEIAWHGLMFVNTGGHAEARRKYFHS